MRLNSYEKEVQREIEAWESGEGSILMQVMNWAMQPMDWVVGKVISGDVEDQVDDVIAQGLSILNDASKWTHDYQDMIESANELSVNVDSIEELRDEPLEKLDELAKSTFSQNQILAAVEGGGTGLGGLVFIAADIPLLFTINLRMIQQIGGAYGFRIDSPDYRPLVLSIFNVAASGGRQAKTDAVREVSVAAAAFANDLAYKGKIRGAFREQNRHLPREIVKNILGRKLAQVIPVAGAAVGAGVNYWFTTETAKTAFMLFRTLYLERKERM